MQQIEVLHHCEPEGWWANAPKLPSLFATGRTYAETRERISAAVPRLTGDGRPTVIHIIQRDDDSAADPIPTGEVQAEAVTGDRETKVDLAVD